MEIVRLTNEKASQEEYVRFLESENKSIEEETEGNPIMPSFARFYLESKFDYNLSENRILEMLKGMKIGIPQSSLNLWMHQIMELLRERLEPLMLAAIRQSKFTNNDATRLLVPWSPLFGGCFSCRSENGACIDIGQFIVLYRANVLVGG